MSVSPTIDTFALPGGLGPCVLPLLDALGWRGDKAHLAEVMPHLQEKIDLSDLLDVMANLKFGSRSVVVSLDALDPHSMPCLFITASGYTFVLIKNDGTIILAFDADTETYCELPANDTREGTAFFFSQTDAHGLSLYAKQPDWFQKVFGRFSKTLRQELVLSFLLSLLTVSMPLFVMLIYDQMPFFDSTRKLTYIIVGVLVFILSEFGLRLIRTGILSFTGARLGNIVGNEVFRRILYLPPAFTESASIGAQATRIKDFDTVRDFFSGPAFVALLDIPFVLLLMLAMWYIGGSIVWVSLAAALLFGVLAGIYLPQVKRTNANVARLNTARQELVMEILTKMQAIRLSSTPHIWATRYRELSAECAACSFQAAQLASQLNVLTNILIMGAGIATMAVSVGNVLAGEMTMGAMVASMILVWRVLAPLRSGFVVMMQVERISKSIAQVNRLMNLDIEQHGESQQVLNRKMQGVVRFSQVSLRYMKDAHPALLGVNFSIDHGEVLGIAGHDGAGKSTIVKCILGLYKPQTGNIFLDKINIRQIDPVLLRRNIAYAPQVPQFFYGTIAQNLRLVYPVAQDDELWEACRKAGVHDEVQALPDALNTRIGDYHMRQYTLDFLKKLNLARMFLLPASLLLLDEALLRPGEESEAFMDTLASLRVKSTIIAVTNHGQYLRLADKILWMEKGRVKDFGPAGEVMPRLPQQYQT